MKKLGFVFILIIFLCTFGCAEEYLLSDPLLQTLNTSLRGGVIETSLPDEVWAALAKKAEDHALWVRNILAADLPEPSRLYDAQQALIAADAGSIDFHQLQRDYYDRYIDADGIAIVGNAAVADEYFHQARETVLVMTSRFPALRDRLRVEHGFYLFIVHNQSNLTEVPEFRLSHIRGVYPSQSCNTTLGATSPGVIGFCWALVHRKAYHPMYSFAHEFAHALDHEMRRLDPTFLDKMTHAYRTARDTKIWDGTPAYRKIYYEYWAEGVQMWFYDIGPGRAFESYEAFAERDPLLYELLDQWFPKVSFPLPTDLDYYDAKERQEHIECFETRCRLE